MTVPTLSIIWTKRVLWSEWRWLVVNPWSCRWPKSLFQFQITL